MAIEIEEVALRSGAAAEWAATALVLGRGEIGVAVDTGDIRAGNGTDTWDDLNRSGSFKSGTAILVAGTVTVTGLTGVTSGDLVFVTVKTLGTVATAKALRAATGTDQIVVTSADATDTSVVQYTVLKA